MTATDQLQASPKKLKSALVIGIGGSGVQTLTRLRRALRDPDRPDHHLMDNVKLLAIDSVGLTDQRPNLSADLTLDPDEFYHLASASPLNAYEYMQQRQQSDERLRNTWDQSYTPPNVPLVQGLKRSRHLGNLVFRVEYDRIKQTILGKIHQANRLESTTYATAIGDSHAVLQVFIVTSCAGGTGSSGFLHVLNAVHAAAREAGIRAEVFPIIYLPDIFAEPRSKGLNAAQEARGHLSNAYAFFSEYDYLLNESGAFPDLLSFDMAGAVRFNSLLDIVGYTFLVDGKLSDGTTLSQKDAFDLATISLHSLLLTRVESVLGVEGTNIVRGFDALDPAQQNTYGSLGALRVVYPGSTYRRYLRARLRAYFLGECLLDDSDTTNELERAQRLISEFQTKVAALYSSLDTKARELRDVGRMLQKARQVPDDLADLDDKKHVADEIESFKSWCAKATVALDTVMAGEQQRAMAEIDAALDTVLIESGEGLKVLLHAVQKATMTLSASVKKLSDDQEEIERTLTYSGGAGEEGSIASHARLIQNALNVRRPNRGKAVERAVSNYADSAAAYAKAIIDSHVTDVQLEVTSEAKNRLEGILAALDVSARQLGDWRREADRTWWDDHFEGKDAGEKNLMFVVPTDAAPTNSNLADIEDTKVATATWQIVHDRISKDPSFLRDPAGNEAGAGGPSLRGRDWLRKVYREWWRLGSEGGKKPVRGLVSLGVGADDPVVASRSAEILTKILDKQVADLGRCDDVVPSSLTDAANLADAAISGDVYSTTQGNGEQARMLDSGLKRILGLSGLVALTADSVAMKPQDGRFSVPPIKVAVLASGDVGERATEILPNATHIDNYDPEQVVTFTMQVGFTSNCIRDVQKWYTTYCDVEKVRDIARRRGIQADDPPPHLDTRFAERAASRPLLRRGYTDDEVAAWTVRGAILDLLAATPDRAFPALVTPFERHVKRVGVMKVAAYQGREVLISDSRFLPQGQPVELGSTVSEIFDTLAKTPPVTQSIDGCFEEVLRTAIASFDDGLPAQLEQIRAKAQAYLDSNRTKLDKLETLANKSAEVKREIEIREAIHVGAGDLIDDLNVVWDDNENVTGP